MADQPQSPAEQWPNEPDVSGVGQKVDHDQEQVDRDIYDQMNPETRIIEQRPRRVAKRRHDHLAFQLKNTWSFNVALTGSCS